MEKGGGGVDYAGVEVLARKKARLLVAPNCSGEIATI